MLAGIKSTSSAPDIFEKWRQVCRGEEEWEPESWGIRKPAEPNADNFDAAVAKFKARKSNAAASEEDMPVDEDDDSSILDSDIEDDTPRRTGSRPIL